MISTKNYKELNIDNIFNQISGYDVFKNYIPQFTDINKSFLSPLRKDRKPDVRIFKTKTGEFMYKDFAYPQHTFGCIKFKQELYNIGFKETLEMINEDFNLGLGYGSTRTAKKVPKIAPKEFLDSIKTEKLIRIVSKEYNWYSRRYFDQYHISQETLERFKVKPIIGYYLNYSYFPCDKTAYAYCFGNYKYKILQPYDEEMKWISNTNNMIIQGWEQLPEKGNLCFITSSLKDVMVLHEIGFTAIAPQSEAGSIPDEIINELEQRFKEVIIFYNNDDPGQRSALSLSNNTGFDFVHLPEEVVEKDPSDYAKEHGLEKLETMINTII